MYNTNLLHERLTHAFKSRYPGFRAMRFVFSSEPGGGKSTVLASVPVPEDKTRIVFDNEDSMAYLDAGPDAEDVYTPRRQQFRMHRIVFPSIEEYARYFQHIQKKPEAVGAVCIDNAAIFQDMIKAFMMSKAENPSALRSIFRQFNAGSILPNDGLIKKAWPNNADGNFWACAKEIPKQFMLMCMQYCIHFLDSTEEGNIWQDYGKPTARIVGKKAKIWDVWYRYTDAVISLVREVNTTKPPFGQLYPNQPKMRLPGLNPRFQMDWEGFVSEIEESVNRTKIEIPENAKVVITDILEEDPPS